MNQDIEPRIHIQARICPFCFDDHSENRECKPADLIEQLKLMEARWKQAEKDVRDYLKTIEAQAAQLQELTHTIQAYKTIFYKVGRRLQSVETFIDRNVYDY